MLIEQRTCARAPGDQILRQEIDGLLRVLRPAA